MSLLWLDRCWKALAMGNNPIRKGRCLAAINFPQSCCLTRACYRAEFQLF
jgi:hypothetical protein